MQGSWIEPVEYIAVLRLLHSKGSTPKEALDQMKVVYGEDATSYESGRPSIETVPIPGHYLFSNNDATFQQIETAILEHRRVT